MPERHCRHSGYPTGAYIRDLATGNGITKAGGSAGARSSSIWSTPTIVLIGQVNAIYSGSIVASSVRYRLARISSLGAATGAQAPILTLAYNELRGTAVVLILLTIGTNSCTTDRQLQFANNTTGGTAGFPTGFFNNSPNNSGVTFSARMPTMTSIPLADGYSRPCSRWC